MLTSAQKRRISVLTNVQMCQEVTNVYVHVDLKLMQMEGCAKVDTLSIVFKSVKRVV